DMGGLPIDPEVMRIIDGHRQVFEDLGCIVEPACPDFRDAHEIAMTLRAYSFELRLGEVMDLHPGVMKATIVRDIEAGRRLNAAQLANTEKMRTKLFQHMHQFMERYEFLV